MAALLAVGIGLGAEKLGRKISEKRLEKKEKKTATEREAIYGTGATSSSSTSAPGVRATQSKNDRKREEARREVQDARREQHGAPEYDGRRRSLSHERLSEDGPPPPRYEDVVREDAGRRV